MMPETDITINLDLPDLLETALEAYLSYLNKDSIYYDSTRKNKLNALRKDDIASQELFVKTYHPEYRGRSI